MRRDDAKGSRRRPPGRAQRAVPRLCSSVLKLRKMILFKELNRRRRRRELCHASIRAVLRVARNGAGVRSRRASFGIVRSPMPTRPAAVTPAVRSSRNRPSSDPAVPSPPGQHPRWGRAEPRTSVSHPAPRSQVDASAPRASTGPRALAAAADAAAATPAVQKDTAPRSSRYSRCGQLCANTIIARICE